MHHPSRQDAESYGYVTIKHTDTFMSKLDGSVEGFGNRLRDAREVRGLNQTELADRAKLQPSAIGHFEKERRRPSFANIRALAKALNVTSDYLLGRSNRLEGATTAFRGEEKLSDGDRDHIQMMIDLMNAKKTKS